MASTITIDGPRPYGVADAPGFGYDIRPGVTPEDWTFGEQDGSLYAWPVDGAPSPITLLPAILHPNWPTATDDTGVFARMRLAQATQSIAGSWEEYGRLTDHDYVWSAKQLNAPITLPIVPAGAGYVIHFFAYGPPIGGGKVLEIAFGHPDVVQTNFTNAFWLNVFEDGRAFLSRGNAAVTAPSDQLANGWIVPNRWGSILGRALKLFIFPHGRNRLLISSSAGHGFVYENPLISREDPVPARVDLLGAAPGGGGITDIHTPPITKSAPVIVNPRDHKMWFQPHILMYMPSGSASPKAGVAGILTDANPAPPFVGETLVAADRRDPSHVSVPYAPPAIQPSGQTGYKPTIQMHRPDATDEDRAYSPQFYRFEPGSPPTVAGKPDSGQNLLADLIRITHTRDKDVLTGEIEARFARKHMDLSAVANVPFQITEDGNVWIEGLLVNPRYSVPGVSSFLQWSIQDPIAFLESKLLENLTRFDGMGIDDAVKATLIAVGFPSDGSQWDIDPTPVTSDGRKLHQLSKGQADDDPTNLVDVFKSAAEWLRYLIQTYTSSSVYPFRWVMGYRPYLNPATQLFETRFYFKDPAMMSQSPVKTWWARQADAISKGASQPRAFRDVHQLFNLDTISAEFNDLWVFGMSPDGGVLTGKNGAALPPAHAFDRNSWNPNLIGSGRPKNWLGEKKQVVYIDSSINTAELQTLVAKILFARGSVARQRATFEAQWEPSVRTWDTVTLDWYDESQDPPIRTSGSFAITQIEAEHDQDIGRSKGPVRMAKYAAERVYN